MFLQETISKRDGENNFIQASQTGHLLGFLMIAGEIKGPELWNFVLEVEGPDVASFSLCKITVSPCLIFPRLFLSTIKISLSLWEGIMESPWTRKA